MKTHIANYDDNTGLYLSKDGSETFSGVKYIVLYKENNSVTVVGKVRCFPLHFVYIQVGLS